MANAERSPIRPERNISLKHLEQIFQSRKDAGEIVFSQPVEDQDKITLYVSSQDGLSTPDEVDTFLHTLTPGHESAYQSKSYFTENAGIQILSYSFSRYNQGRNGAKTLIVRAMPNDAYVQAAYTSHQNILSRMETDSAYSFSPEYSPLLNGIIQIHSRHSRNGNISS